MGRKKRQRKPAIEEDTSNLPCEVIFIILSKLPVKSLLRFRCVCKPWLSLISEPQFIKTHLIESIVKSDRRKILSSTYRSDSFYSVDSEYSFKPEQLCFPIKKYRRARVLCSCNGLVLLGVDNDKMYVLWNPSTRTYKKFSCPYSIEFSVTYYGICYNSSTDDYKVVFIVPELDNSSYFVVYTFKNNTWTDIREFPNFILSMGTGYIAQYVDLVDRAGVAINGAPHWVLKVKPSTPTVVPNSTNTPTAPAPAPSNDSSDSDETSSSSSNGDVDSDSDSSTSETSSSSNGDVDSDSDSSTSEISSFSNGNVDSDSDSSSSETSSSDDKKSDGVELTSHGCSTSGVGKDIASSDGTKKLLGTSHDSSETSSSSSNDDEEDVNKFPNGGRVMGVRRDISSDSDYSSSDSSDTSETSSSDDSIYDYNKHIYIGMDRPMQGYRHDCDKNYVIVYFDFVEETFKEVPPPYWLCEGDVFGLTVIRGWLSLYISTNDYFKVVEIWTMKEYGERNSWAKLIRIPCEERPNRSLDQRNQPIPLFSTKKDEVVMLYEPGVELVLYNPKENMRRNITPSKNGMGYFSSLVSYVDTLVLPTRDKLTKRQRKKRQGEGKGKGKES